MRNGCEKSWTKFEVVKKLDGRFIIFFVVDTKVPPDFFSSADPCIIMCIVYCVRSRANED